MKRKIPEKIKEVGFDFDWNPSKVWGLVEPVSKIHISELVWHFDIPFLWEGDLAVTPKEIMGDPKRHPSEYNRMLRADTSHPIDIMQHKGRWLILDGLHRLMKLHSQGIETIEVRIIPRERIKEITK